MKEIQRRRKLVCLNIAEEIEHQFKLERTAYDVDKAAKTIESLMPLSIKESIQEWADMKEDSEKEKQPSGLSLSQRLRDALRTDTGGIGNLIEEAIRKLNGFYLLTEKINVALQKESEHLNDLATILMKVH